MSTLQHDELLTQSEILEKETVPPAKEAYQHSEAEPEEAKHGPDLQQNGGEMAAAILLISRRAGVLANHKAAHGRILCLSLRMLSTISVTAAPGA